MWKGVAKQVVSSRKLVRISPKCCFQPIAKPFELKNHEKFGLLEMGLGCRRYGEELGRPISSCFSNSIANYPKGYASVAEAVVASTDTEEDMVEEIKSLRNKVGNQENNGFEFRKHREKRVFHGRYREQVKIETDAWNQAAIEYKELLADMCEHKLAPNLPYMKSLFLGWFEPLRDAIVKEQELWRQGKSRASYAPYFDHLPADMMSLITMHKLMALLMTGGEHGCARVVQASIQIGEAIEQEVRIQRFLEKTRKSKDKKAEKGESDTVAKEQERLRKRVTTLMKKQKLHAVKQIVKGQNDLKPWGQDNQAKVGSRLIELLMETAYIQPPVDQLADGPPDIRPAFRHSLQTVSKDNQKSSRRYGVITCDPLVRQGLEKTARHMVIPYMPMLVPPMNWNGYDKGGYLFLPSYIMRTHGAKQQRDAVKWTPKKQLEPIFE
ncbi:Dna-directed rna polymerase 2 protein, partial [Thalictrum thalictroides]